MIDDGSSGVEGKDVYRRRVELVLVSLSELYSELESILVGTRSTLLVYLTPSTDYPNY